MTARMRWLIGGGVAAVALAVAAGAAVVLSARAVPEALRYMPGNAVAVAELRLDLPGDQFQKVGNLLSHFPGFADQSTLPTKLNETLDRLVKDATNGSTDYSTKLKPWLAGPTFAAALPPPGAGTGTATPAAASAGIESPGTTATGRPSDYVVVSTTDGTVTCATAIPNGSSQPIPQGQLRVAAEGDDACFMDGRFGLLGTRAAITAALDAHTAGSGMDRDPQYTKARDALAGERLATLYVSGKAAANLIGSAGASMPPVLPTSLPFGLPSAAALPDWVVAGIRAEDDALVADVIVSPAAAGIASAAPIGSGLATLPPPHGSEIAGFIPGNTIAVAEAHGVGAVAQNALAALQADPQFKSIAGQLNGALAAAGGAGGLLGWVNDAGVVILPQSTASAAGAEPGVDAGLVLVATDEATATARVTQLKNLLSLIAFSANGSVSDVSVDGTTITTVDLGDLSKLIGASGAGSQLGGVTIPADVHVKFTLASRGKLVLLGGDESFARDVLGVQAGATLADDAAYKRALSRGFASNLGQVYVAGSAARSFAERSLPAGEQARWKSDLLPYAAPIDAALVTTTLENGLSHARMVVTVSTPSPTPSGS
jgi:hypothetical protein